MRAVVARGGLLELERAALLEDAPVVRAEGVGHVAGEDVVIGLARDLGLLQLEELLELAVDEQVAAVRVLERDHRRAVVEDRLQLLLAPVDRVERGSELGREVAEQPAEQEEAGSPRKEADHAGLDVVECRPGAEQRDRHEAATTPPVAPASTATSAIGSV